MADRTHIEWCHATINAISGCTPVSPGCTNCYAMRAGGMNRPHHPSAGLTQPSKAGHVWTGAVRLNEEWLRKPLAWQQPRRIFWNAHGDPWHESVPFEWVDREMAIAALTPRHRHLFLTKRSARMRRYFANAHTPERILEAAKAIKALPAQWSWPLPNVWLGVSVEDQTRAEERLPDLLQTPAAIHFASAEPLLGPLDLTRVMTNAEPWAERVNALTGRTYGAFGEPGPRMSLGLDWVIVGGESGPGSRPMHPDWDRSLLRQCLDTRTAFLMKQWGDWAPVSEMTDEQVDRCYAPAPEHDPEARRRRLVDACVLHADGSRFDGKAMYEFGAFAANSRAMTMMRVGKRAAGRTLDRVIWDQYPELFPHEQLQPAAAQEALPA